MVSTRHRPSLDNNLNGSRSPSHKNDEREKEEENPAVRRIKQKLAIDATSSLGGSQTAPAERTKKKVLGTYTFRGAVYELDENTPLEWIESYGSKREEKRSRKEAGAGAEADGPSRKRRRRTDSVLVEDKGGKKRRSLSEQVDGQRAKSPPAPTSPAGKKSARRKTWSSSRQRQKTSVARPSQESKEDAPSTNQLAVEEQESHSYQSDNDSVTSDIRHGRNQYTSLAREITRSRIEARSKNYAIEMLSSADLEAFAAARQKSAIGRLARSLLEMSKLNGRVAKLQDRYAKRKEKGDFEKVLKLARERVKTSEQTSNGDDVSARPQATAEQRVGFLQNNDRTVFQIGHEGLPSSVARTTPPSSIPGLDGSDDRDKLPTISGNAPPYATQQRTPDVASRRQDTPLDASISSSHQHQSAGLSPDVAYNADVTSSKMSKAPEPRSTPLPTKSSFVALVTNPTPAAPDSIPPKPSQTTSPPTHWPPTSADTRVGTTLQDGPADYPRPRHASPHDAKEVLRAQRPFSRDFRDDANVGGGGEGNFSDEQRQYRARQKERERRAMEMWALVDKRNG
jgi:hypothetical protein